MSGITVFEAAARLARTHAGTTVSELMAGELLGLVAALNGALSEFWQTVPPVYREQTLALSGMPRSGVAVTCTEGSQAVSAATFQEAEIGRSLVFSGGDGAMYRVAGAGSILPAWGGASGSFTCTVMPDSLRLSIDGVHVEQLVGDPLLIDSDGTRHRLSMIPAFDREDLRVVRSGRPEGYWLEMSGIADGEASSAQIRLWPVPATHVRVQVRALWVPARLRATDVSGSVRLNVPPSLVDDFLDIAGGKLAVIPGFFRIDPQTAAQVASLAAGRLRARSPAASTPHNRVGTPIGW